MDVMLVMWASQPMLQSLNTLVKAMQARRATTADVADAIRTAKEVIRKRYMGDPTAAEVEDRDTAFKGHVFRELDNIMAFQ